MKLFKGAVWLALAAASVLQVAHCSQPFDKVEGALKPWVQKLHSLAQDLSHPSELLGLSSPQHSPQSGPGGQGARAGPVTGCQKVSACACQTEDGGMMDLSPLASSNGLPRFLDVPGPTGEISYNYSWNPCTSFSEGDCKDVGACQMVPSDQGPGPLYISLGGQNAVDFVVSSQRGLMLQYTGPGDQYIPMRTTFIQLQCDQSVEGQLTVEGEVADKAGLYYMTLTSRHACVGRGNSTSPPPITPPTPGVVTVTSGPSPDPGHDLQTIINLLFALTLLAGVGLLLLLLLLVVLCVRSRSAALSRPPPYRPVLLPPRQSPLQLDAKMLESQQP